MNNQKTNLSNVEIEGSIVLFNKALNEYNGMTDLKVEFFYSGDLINSEDDANGHPLEIDGHNLSHLKLLENHVLLAICYDEDDNEIVFRVDYNGFTQL